MHDRVADADLRQVAHHRVDVRATSGIALAATDRAGIELRFGDDGELRGGPDESRGERRNAKCDLRIARDEGPKIFDERRMHAVFPEVMLHRFPATGAFRHDQQASIEELDRALQRDQRIVGAPIHLDRWKTPHRRINGLRRLRRERLDSDARERLHDRVECVLRKEKLMWRQQRS